MWHKAQIEVIRPTARFESVKLRTKVGRMVTEDTKLIPIENMLQSAVSAKKFRRALLLERSVTWFRRRELASRFEHANIKLNATSKTVVG